MSFLNLLKEHWKTVALSLVFIAAAITLLVLWATGTFHKAGGNRQPTTASTLRSFSAIELEDHKKLTDQIVSGDTVTLKYTGKGVGPVRWQYNTEELPQVFVSITESTTQNPYVWQVPGNLFQKIRLRVQSVENTTILATSKAAIQVTPVVTWTYGQSGSTAYVTQTGTLKMTYSALGDWIQEGGVSLSFAQTGTQDFKAVDGSKISVDTHNSTLSYTGVDIDPGIYNAQVSTTSLKTRGYAHELVFTFSDTIQVRLPTGTNTAGTLGTVISTNENGVHGVATAGGTVGLTLNAFAGGSVDWYYALGDELKVNKNWVMIQAGVTPTPNINWTVPKGMHGEVMIRAVTTGSDVTTATDGSLAEGLISIGGYLILLSDSDHVSPEISYLESRPRVEIPDGRKSSAVDILRSVIVEAVNGATDKNMYSDISHWTVGWYAYPSNISPEERILPNPVRSATFKVSPSNPSSVIVTLLYVDRGYDLLEEKNVNSIEVPLWIQFKTDETMSITSSSKYKLMRF